LISIIAPVYNEEKNISLLYAELVKVFEKIQYDFDYEILFVDDGSSDYSSVILEKLARDSARVKYIQFSRNFGKEFALSAGLDAADGDAVVMIDADLQHPVEIIPDFINKWRDGAEVVVGVRQVNHGEGWIKKYGSLVFYKIMDVISETKITPQATDFRLLDRKVVIAFRNFTEHGRMTRGLIDWLGFTRDYVYFEARARLNGCARYDTKKLFKLAFSTMVSHSLLPLKLAGYLGAFILTIFGAIGLLILLGKYLFHNKLAMSFSGPAQLAILIVFLVGLILACLGLIALYVGNIKAEVVNRPRYVIRRTNLHKML